MIASVLTLGCKVNDVESSSILTGLKELGYEVKRTFSYADLYVVNTCAVTKEAERKSRQAIAKALKFNPDAKVVVMGCASEKSPSDFADKPNVVCVLGTNRKAKVMEIAKSGCKNVGVLVGTKETEFEELPFPERMKTRDYIKIQDGCNRFCSYCIIPYLRGRSRSRKLESIVEEVNRSTAEEIVLTGIDVSDYHDGDRDFSCLLHALKDCPARIRLGSLEESLITDGFLSALKELNNFAPQFHLCLQSGSTEVLKKMNRHYTKEQYLEKCRLILKYFPNALFTTDIIVGFPTETNEDFEDTLSIVRQVGFLHVHAFPYSAREGTNAWKQYREIPSSVKKSRLDTLLGVAEEVKKKTLSKQLGKTLTVIPETYENGYTVGYAETYIRVYISGKTEKKPTLVMAEELYLDGIKAVKV